MQTCKATQILNLGTAEFVLVNSHSLINLAYQVKDRGELILGLILSGQLAV
jgi:hypothetical protein